MKEINSEITENQNALKWACRRGMLELDVLLNNFLNEAYANLKLEDKELFIQLLKCSDPEIFSWLLGQNEPNEEGLMKITKAIREHARSRF